MSSVGKAVQGVVYGNTDTNRTKEEIQRISPYYFSEGENLARTGLTGATQALPQATDAANKAGAAYSAAAASPVFGQGTNYLQSLLRGDELGGSPQFKALLDSLNASATRSGADLAARTRSQMALQGTPGMSTSTLQAIQAGNAAAQAQANEMKAQAIAQNEQTAQGRRLQGLSMAPQIVAAPAQLQQQASSAYLTPYQQLASVLSGLDRGPTNLEKYNTIVSQNKNAGLADYVQSAASAYATLYGGGLMGSNNNIANPSLSGSQYLDATGNPQTAQRATPVSTPYWS